MFWRPDIEADHEPHKIFIHKGEFFDETRDGREVPYKVYYPAAHNLGPLPVIIWSHGLGGSRDGAAFLARYISSHGYVVMNIQHLGTDSSLWEGKDGHPWDVIRETHIPRSASLNRFYDVPFVLNQLPVFVREVPKVGEHMDIETIGMCGHSFGALTTQVMSGQLFPDENEKLAAIREDRFKAGILYSFVPMGHLTDAPPEEIYGPIDMPLLFMTGTEDSSPVKDFDYKHRLPVYEHAGSAEKALLVLKDGDHMVFAGSRGKLRDNPKRQDHESIIKITSLAFWDAHLKDNSDARAWLTGDEIGTYLKDDAEYGHQGPA